MSSFDFYGAETGETLHGSGERNRPGTLPFGSPGRGLRRLLPLVVVSVVLSVFAAAGCERSLKVDDGRVRVAEGSYRAPVVVNAPDGRAFALALRTDRSPHEVWRVALDGSGACSLGPVHGTDVRYGVEPEDLKVGASEVIHEGHLARPAEGWLGSPMRLVVGDFTDGVGTVRYADTDCRPVRRLDDVLVEAFNPPLIDATGRADAFETRDHAVHLLDPWSGTDHVIVRGATAWGSANGIGAWALVGGTVRLWRADGTEIRHLGTAVTEVVGSWPSLIYVDGDDVWRWSGSGSPTRLTASGNACGLRRLESGATAFFAPCADRQLVVAPPRAVAGLTTVPGARDVVTVHMLPSGWLVYATEAADGTRTMWAVEGLDGDRVEVGPWRDTTGWVWILRGSNIMLVYVGLKGSDGTSTWGLWDAAGFHALATHVHATTLLVDGALVTMTDVSNGAGTLRVFAPPTDELGPSAAPLLTVPGVGADSVLAPGDLETIVDLEGFDAATGAGDLAVRDPSGHRVVIDHRVTGYADVFAPVRGFVYTVSDGPRAGVWLAVTGTP